MEPPLPARSPLRPPPPPKQQRSTTPEVSSTPPPSKRNHAIQELLASEKAYASDLALVRQVHIPLALGQPIQLASTLLTSTVEAPMTAEDCKIIFSNIVQVSQFADKFCEALQAAIDSDTVGALFLESIPDMERPYKVYISKHETAANHFHSLPISTALSAYHTQTRTIASSLSHAWDLNSMLIKPVQRLLKYPLLLGTIYDETPNVHSDKENLRLARDAVQSLAHRVNEERRRAEIVKDVLKRTNKDLLVRIKNLKPVPPPDSDESLRVFHLHNQLLQTQSFTNQLAQNVLQWSHSVTACTSQLHVFALSFANVIGLSPDVQSDAFDAFLSAITDQLLPHTTTLFQHLSDSLLTPLSQLLDTLNNPLHLLETLQTTLLPLHTHLIHMPYSPKNRPPPELIKASAEYLALRSKLSEELPVYLTMTERVLAGSLLRLARIQTDFWQRTSHIWSELWTLLRVEGDDLETGNTVQVWWQRWEEVDTITSRLRLVQHASMSPPTPPAIRTSPPAVKSISSRTSASSSSLSNTTTAVSSLLSSLEPARAQSLPPPATAKLSTPNITSKGQKLGTEYEYDFGYDYVTAVGSPLSALSPKKSKSKTRRPSTSSGSPTDIHHKLSFRRKLSDSAMQEKAQDALYSVRSVYAFEPPPDPRVTSGKKSKTATYIYDSYPFLALKNGEIFDVIKEAGHPRDHLSRGLMLYVDDGASDEPDALLLVRRKAPSRSKGKNAEVGWALASYLQPSDTS
ncbi:Dbl homology domain-containing protein [Hymenopellis radicata]|nr:Dbl homology domain-containing protein [Hymenopellis radicata]